MKIVRISSNGGSQENVFYSNINRNKGGKTSFWGQHKSSHGGHHQYEGQPHGGGQGNFKGRRSHGGHQGQQPNGNSNYYYCSLI